MKLTELQLECQRLGADMTLSFGCMVVVEGEIGLVVDKVTNNNNIRIQWCGVNRSVMISYLDKNAGHPIDRGRLCYLRRTHKGDYRNTEPVNIWHDINCVFDEDPELYQGNILTRPDSILLNVRNFLLSIQNNNRGPTTHKDS